MPIKSKAQRRKFAELLMKGEITPETFEEWNRGAGDAELPERLHPKKPAKRKRKPTAKRKTAARRKTAAKRKTTAKRKAKPRRAARRKSRAKRVTKRTSGR
jgi:hypothetical protein